MCASVGLRVCAIIGACLAAILPSRAPALSPVVDPGTSATVSTPEDPDLIIHRELYYGGEGVDLSQLHLVTETGPTSYVTRGPDPGSDETYVQSLLVRLLCENPEGQFAAVEGSITLPAAVTVRGVITNVYDMPSLTYVDPDLTNDIPNSDAVFAVTDLTYFWRFLETDGWDAGGLDYVHVSGSTVFFRLGVHTGSDDFRILLDYGGDPEPNLTFSVALLGGTFMECERSGGLILGDTDYGEGWYFGCLPLTVPEPTLGLVAVGAAVLLVRRRRGAAKRN
jgi:hypothetical protein